MAFHLANWPETSPKLNRALTQRQLTMMTIGGAIGVGLFLGSSVTIRLAGPGVILSYLFSAIIALIVAYSVAEMAVTHPVPGSFGVYAQTYLNEWSGFTVRVTYAFVQILAIGAEVTAVAIYFSLWFPTVPQWIWVVGVSVGLIAVNRLHVGNFGEFEYWFAIIKVIAIVSFILVGLGLIFGAGPARAIGFSNLVSHGGFLPSGLKGVGLALSLALTSYMGVEIIGITAGEALQPEKTIPHAMRTVILRLILFYVLSITVMLSMTPWDRMGSGITGSPFVLAFAKVGIPYAAKIMNVVVITAALSSANTNLYTTSRTLFSLSHDGYLSKALSNLGRNGVPYAALMVSAAGMVAAILLAIFVPGRAFLLLYGVAVAGMFFVWSIILLAHLSFRRSIGKDRLAQLPIRLPFSPYPQIAALIALAAIAISTYQVEDLEYSVPSFTAFLLVITVFCWTAKRRNRSKGGTALNALS
ncbi:amino acid permease [Alloacidobacterium sp.]|uniref:amino acid permease n=1 Tax=Alloacidobacterium sp. TaxID=2951999 RepID=UPI002D5C2661|nr:amino acid permease [Alloacidobacterium sp.]HYK34320.1 amino acid permease [Alloacidobacterium sp.]